MSGPIGASAGSVGDRVTTLRAGAGRARIELSEEFFPLEGFSGVHDSLHVRVAILDCGARVALVSVEMTSLPKEQIASLRELVGELGSLPVENVWICVTHTMSAPHVRPAGTGPESIEATKDARLSDRMEAAAREATHQAVASLQEARLGHACGTCDVNVNRDISTSEGWWVGHNEAGFSDKTATVLRVETMDGRPIAILFSHCVRPAVIECAPHSRENALVTADLTGAASASVEEAYGGEVTALFLMGTAGDQSPRLPGTGAGQPSEGQGLRRDSSSDKDFVAIDKIGRLLGAEVMRLCEAVECHGVRGPILSKSVSVKFEGQELPDTRSIRPTRDYVFTGGPDRTEWLHFIVLDDVALVGVSPELSCRTGVDTKDGSPFSDTLVLTMVNGASKCMAEAEAYDRMTYESMNSPFARGSAERLAEHATETLWELQNRDGS